MVLVFSIHSMNQTKNYHYEQTFLPRHLDLGHLASRSPILEHPKEVFSITQPSNPKMEYEITKRLLPLAITHDI